MLRSPESLTDTNQSRENLNNLNPEFALAYLLNSQADKELAQSNSPTDVLRQGAMRLSKKIGDLAEDPEYSELPFGHRLRTYTPENIAGFLNRIALGELKINSPYIPDDEQELPYSSNPYRRVSQEQELAILHLTDLLVPNLQGNIQQLIQYRATTLYDQFDNERLIENFQHRIKTKATIQRDERKSNYSKKRLKAEKANNDVQIQALVKALEDQIKIEDLRVLDLTDEHKVPNTPVKLSLNNQLRLGFTEAKINFSETLPSISLRAAKKDLRISPPEELPADFETKNSFSQNLYTIALSVASLRQLVSETPSAYRLHAELWGNSERRTLQRMLNNLLQTNPYNRHSLGDLYQGARADASRRKILYSSSVALVLAACGSTSGAIKTEVPSGVTTGPQITAVVTESISQQSESTAIPTPTRPDLTDGAGGQYTQEQIDLINGSAFSQQEEMIWQWISEYWGFPGAQNRPFLPEAVDMHYIYFFDKNNPQNALVALQPGGDYGSRIFYLPIKEGQFMQAPPEAPEGEFYIPEGFGPLEISGDQWQLAVVDGQWVRIDEAGQVKERINLETAQWEELNNISFETGNWAERDDGTLNPEITYPLVGAIDKKHHTVIDLSYNGLQVAVVTDEDVSQKDADSYDQFKNSQATQINNNLDLKSQLDQVKSQVDQNNLDKYTVVIENGAVKWVVDQTNEILISYRQLDAEGKLTIEVEQQLLPELRVNGAYIERTDTGEVIQFKGVNILSYNLRYQLKYIDLAHKIWGINIIRIQLDVDKLDFDLLKEVIDFSENKGIYVFVTPAMKNEEHIAEPNQEFQEFIVGLAEKFNNHNNIIYGIVNEIGDLPESSWYDEQLEAILAIREVNPNSIIAISGRYFNRNFSYFRNHPYSLSNLIYDVHNYQSPKWPHDFEWMLGLYPVIFSEAGVPLHRGGNTNPDDAIFIKKTLEYVRINPYMTHWIAFVMTSSTPEKTGLVDSDGNLIGRGLIYNEDIRDTSATPLTNFTE